MEVAPDRLSLILAALADPTRRAILARLAGGELPVGELARPFAISAPAVTKHLKVLERAGLITRGREAQWRPCRLDAAPLQEVADWVEQYRQHWEARIDRLEAYLRTLEAQERNPMSTLTESTADREIVISRLINAPRERVFAAWTDPQQVGQWWGPQGFTTTTQAMDVRPGGRWSYVMRGPDGTDYDNLIVYSEVERPARLVYAHGSGDENDPHQFQTTVTFEDEGGQTRLTMRSLFASAAARDYVVREFGAIEGGNSTLDRLEEYLAGR